MKNLAKKRGRSGHTLVEVTLSLVLLGILAVTAFYGSLAGVDVYVVTARDYLGLFQAGRVALEKMAREIRETSPDAITISTGEVSFTKQSDHVTPLDSSETIRFYQVSGQNEIRREGDASGVRTLARDVQASSFNPSQDSNGVVTLGFVMERGDTSIPLQTAILPRVPEEEEEE